MKTNISLELREFPVIVRDERTGEEICDTVVLDKTRLQAAQIVGQSCKELIQRLYNRQGYRVVEIGTPERRSVNLNLEELWNLHNKVVGE
jgi:hypothetical protein